jgi:AraC-like DNA-binding protein
MFPNFNLYSTPLLILSSQALIFAFLLFYKYKQTKNISNLFLALILLLSSYSQICYTIGFMGWYDTYRNTKINYFLYNITIILAPLIYLYIKSITTSNFKFRKKDWWHFSLAIVFIFYRLSIFIYDAKQLGFNETQNGVLKISLDDAFIQPIMGFIEFPIMLLYLAFTLQLYYNYRKKIIHYFSNTYKLELNWILSFLLLFTIIFLYGTVQTLIGSYFTDLNYQQRWWLSLFKAIITLYVGIKGYFTDTTKLKKLDFSFSPNKDAIPEINYNSNIKSFSDIDVEKIKNLMIVEKVYLNPELNLSDLAKKAKMSRAQLSEIINSEFHKNFNDFVNGYRVKAFKSMLKDGKHKQLSLLGVAFECGFNSKATFNRVFKKLTSLSPSQYLNSDS